MQTLPEQIIARKEEISTLGKQGNVLALVIMHTVRAKALNEAPMYIQWCLDNMEGWDETTSKEA